MKEHQRHKTYRTRLVGIIFSLAVILCASFIVLSNPTPTNADGGVTTCECTNTYSDGTTKTEAGAESILLGDGNGCFFVAVPKA